MAQVVEINDPAELAGCRLLWTKLYSETAGASFFHSLDWLETYWRHHGDRQRLRVLVVEAAGGPIGILPLVVRRETTRLGTIRVLTYPLEDWGSFYGPIGPYPTATLIAGLGHVRRTEVDWDLIDLRWIDGLAACDRTLRAMEIRGMSATTAVWAKSAQVELTGGWEAYWASPQADLAEECSLCRKAAVASWPGGVRPVPAARCRLGRGRSLLDAVRRLRVVGHAELARKFDDRHHAVARRGPTVFARGSRGGGTCRSGRHQFAIGRRVCRWRLPTAIRVPVMFTACGWVLTTSKPTKERARCCWRV